MVKISRNSISKADEYRNSIGIFKMETAQLLDTQVDTENNCLDAPFIETEPRFSSFQKSGVVDEILVDDGDAPFITAIKMTIPVRSWTNLGILALISCVAQS